MGNRKEAENFIYDFINSLSPGNLVVGIYKKLFGSMSDETFDKYMDDFEKEKKYLVFISPNFGEHNLSTERNLDIADKLGYNFFQQIWFGQKGDIPAYLTPEENLIMDVPIRRASQLLTKKIRVPEHNQTVDFLTNQPTGESKRSKISAPELKILATMNIDPAITELIKYRGGDARGYAALNGMLSRYGKANLNTLNNFADGVGSTKTLKSYLTAMHLNTTL